MPFNQTTHDQLERRRQDIDWGDLRRGRQSLREISDSGEPGGFGLPHMIGGQIRSVVL